VTDPSAPPAVAVRPHVGAAQRWVPAFDSCVTVAIHGDVDRDGEIVDSARLERLRSAVGEFCAPSIDPLAQVDLVQTLLVRAREAAA